MPVARGARSGPDSADLEALGVEIVLAQHVPPDARPGADVVDDARRAAPVHGLGRTVLTDSGGFQVFSLAPEGRRRRASPSLDVRRRAPIGSRPERRSRSQEQLGADIQMVLDVCPPLPSSPEVLRTAVERTAAWAARAQAAHAAAPTRRSSGSSRAAPTRPPGRERRAHRRASASTATASAGSRWGSPAPRCCPRCGCHRRAPGGPPPLPHGRRRSRRPGRSGRPRRRHVRLRAADPARPARHGADRAGRLNLRNCAFAADDGPLDPACPAGSAPWSRAYLRHLLSVREPTGPRLVTVHNVAWTLRFVERMREAIRSGRFAAFQQDTTTIWG